MRRLLAASALVLLAAACGTAPPTSGYVRDKRFDPAHEVRHSNPPVCTPVGKVEVCVPMPDTVEQVPDRWWLYLEDCVRDAKTDRPKCHRGWLPVDETDFHAYPLGAHYPDAR